MTRLPTPGRDNGAWGEILNAFLNVEHNPDGTLKASGSLATKANDTAVVHLTGSEMIAGNKDFTGSLTHNGVTVVNSARTISAGTGLVGGGDLSGDRTLSVDYGTTAGTAAQGNDARITGAEQTTNKGVASGYAPLNSSSKVPIINLPTGTVATSVTIGNDSRLVEPSVGVYVPPGWGSNLKAKLVTKGKIAVLGDSVSRGYYTSNLDTKSWPGLLKTRLQAAYGADGSGWKGIVDSSAWATAAGIDATAQSSYTTAGNYWTLNGVWANYNSNAFGIGGASISTHAAGAYAQCSVTGTTIKIFTIGGNSAWNYQIDGGTVTAGAIGSYQTVNATTITGLSAGSHIVRIFYNGDGISVLYLNGVAGENATGIVVDNFAQYGAASGLINNIDDLTNGAGMGGNLYPADLVIYAMGLNDAGNNVSTETFVSNFDRYVSLVRDGGSATGAVDLMIVMCHVGKYDQTNYLFAHYCAAMRGVAAAYGAAYVNVWAIMENSWNYFNTLNGWGNAMTIGSPGSDLVHLSDGGANLYYQAINTVIQTYIG